MTPTPRTTASPPLIPLVYKGVTTLSEVPQAMGTHIWITVVTQAVIHNAMAPIGIVPGEPSQCIPPLDTPLPYT